VNKLICAETNEEQARAIAAESYAKYRAPKQLLEWDGDLGKETLLEEQS
jgi:hypothetical protein